MKTIVVLKPAPGTDLEAIMRVLPREEPVLWSYLASGECRAVHYDEAVPSGVVLEFETAEPERVRALVEAFPLVAEGLHTPEYHRLAPYTGLALMFRPDTGFAPRMPEAWERPRT